jgi:hypothetical protein
VASCALRKTHKLTTIKVEYKMHGKVFSRECPTLNSTCAFNVVLSNITLPQNHNTRTSPSPKIINFHHFQTPINITVKPVTPPTKTTTSHKHRNKQL